MPILRKLTPEERAQRDIELELMINEKAHPLFDISKMFENVVPQMSKFAESFAQPAPLIQALQVPNPMLEALKNMDKYLERFRAMMDGFMENIRKILDFIHTPILQAFKSIGFIFEILRTSTVTLVVNTARGDPLSTDALGKRWWQISLAFRKKYYYENGHYPSQQEIDGFFKTHCFELLQTKENDFKDKPVPEAIQYAFFWLLGKLKVNVVEVVNVDPNELNSSIEYQYAYLKNWVIYHNDNPYLLTPTVAQVAQVSEQTIRNWIHQGKLKAVKLSWQSRITLITRQVFHIPFAPDLISALHKIKQDNELTQSGIKDSLYTVSQVTELTKISRSTLKRWDKQNLLVPLRINTIRYYTRKDLQKALKMYRDNNSRQSQSFFASNLQLAQALT